MDPIDPSIDREDLIKDPRAYLKGAVYEQTPASAICRRFPSDAKMMSLSSSMPSSAIRKGCPVVVCTHSPLKWTSAREVGSAGMSFLRCLYSVDFTAVSVGNLAATSSKFGNAATSCTFSRYSCGTGRRFSSILLFREHTIFLASSSPSSRGWLWVSLMAVTRSFPSVVMVPEQCEFLLRVHRQ